MGDLDKDGFGDFAVGAPYEDNGKGVIIGIFLLYTEKLQPGVRLCKYHPKKLNNKIE